METGEERNVGINNISRREVYLTWALKLGRFYISRVKMIGYFRYKECCMTESRMPTEHGDLRNHGETGTIRMEGSS